jgi:NAD(P)-dependent dehydrogenase (short-subunit alcohol dehydrogenase family)
MAMATASERGVALVTGAGNGQGIGYAVATALAARGFDVALASLENPGPELGAFETLGGRARYYPFDLADIDRHGALLDRIEQELGALSCLVNNAGVSSMVRGDLIELTPESFDRSVAINLRGTFFLSQAVARRMLAAPLMPAALATPAAPATLLRSIVTISSANADIVGENRGDYCMTKAALTMMNRLFASRLAEAGIACFEVRPGIIRTDMTAPAFERYDPLVKNGGVPMRRWGQPDDIGTVVATLACGGMPYTTGSHIDVGGGLQLHRI